MLLSSSSFFGFNWCKTISFFPQETETLRHSLVHEITIKEKLEEEAEEVYKYIYYTVMTVITCICCQMKAKVEELETAILEIKTDKESLEKRAEEVRPLQWDSLFPITCAVIKRAGASINYHYKNSLFPIKAMNNENIELRGGSMWAGNGKQWIQLQWPNREFFFKFRILNTCDGFPVY